jgi:hypothetical protein
MAAPPTNIFLYTPCIHVTIETWQNLQHQILFRIAKLTHSSSFFWGQIFGTSR